MADDISNASAVLFEERETSTGHRIAFAQLNAEKSLNALTLDMIRLLDARLQQWQDDASVVCVVLMGAGEKAFCAGGDVRSLRDSILAHKAPGPNPQAQAFFSEEYRLDYRIHKYPKPILLWGNGIVMGGGLGLFAGASHRVVTEKSRIAMPEVSIGLYPDVGGSWFLPRMPGRIGLFLALTGASINAHDALFVRLADYFLKSDDREFLFESLLGAAWSSSAQKNRNALSQLLQSLAQRAAEVLPESNVRRNADAIQALTHGESLLDVRNAISRYNGGDAWMARAASALASGSPTSIALMWEIWRRAKHLSLAEVFRMELIISLQCCEHPDFPEGVRALLVDEDNRPVWTPPDLEEVSESWISGHFTAPWSAWNNEPHPLADL